MDYILDYPIRIYIATCTVSSIELQFIAISTGTLIATNCVVADMLTSSIVLITFMSIYIMSMHVYTNNIIYELLITTYVCNKKADFLILTYSIYIRT